LTPGPKRKFESKGTNSMRGGALFIQGSHLRSQKYLRGVATPKRGGLYRPGQPENETLKERKAKRGAVASVG